MALRSRLLPPDVAPPEWAPEKETLDHFERFAWNLRLEDGSRFRLRDFQLTKLEDYFARRQIETADPATPAAFEPVYFEHLWLEPTGQGKSGIMGAVALHHGMFCVPRPRVFVLGGEAGHAQNTTNAAASFVHEARALGEPLGFLWDPQAHAGGRLMPAWLDGDDLGIFARTAGRKVARKGGSSVEGKNPTLILVEELHRHEDGGTALDVLQTKTAKANVYGRTVKTVIVTTAGTNRKSRLGRMIDRLTDADEGATVQTDLRPGEYYRRGVDRTGERVGHMWEVPEKLSPLDLDVDAWIEHVVRANPAEWITPRVLRRIWDGLDRHGQWQFLRQNANQWVAAGFAAIDRAQWWRLVAKDEHGNRIKLEIPAGKGIKVFVGLDRASKWDSTAIVPVWKPPDGAPIRVAGAVILDSPQNGRRRRTSDVADVLNSMRERWPDMVIVFDRNAGGGDVAEELEEEHGLTIIDHDQGIAFDLASMRLGEYVEGAKLEHDGNEALSTQVLAAVMRETAAGKRWRGEAPDDETPADGFDALAMALHMAAAPVEESKPFNPDDYRIRPV